MPFIYSWIHLSDIGIDNFVNQWPKKCEREGISYIYAQRNALYNLFPIQMIILKKITILHMHIKNLIAFETISGT